MATNNLKTDYWVEDENPISNVKSDKWLFAEATHTPILLKSDKWLFTQGAHIPILLKTDRWGFSSISNTNFLIMFN